MADELLHELVPNEMVWGHLTAFDDLTLEPGQFELVREGLARNPDEVNRLIARALTMRSPTGYLIVALRTIAEEGWPYSTGPGIGPDAKLRDKMKYLAINLRRSQQWTGLMARGADGREVWLDEEAEWAAYVRQECHDAGVPSVADSVIRAARTAIPQIAKAPPDGSPSVTRYQRIAR
jgi:hypothetical protein